MPKSRKATKVERVMMDPAEVANMPSKCVWRGCEATKPGLGPLPSNWNYLFLYWAPEMNLNRTVLDIVNSPFNARDAVLCPTHSRELDALLEPIPDRRLQGDAQGHG